MEGREGSECSVDFIWNPEMEEYIAPSLLKLTTDEAGEEAIDMSHEGSGSTQLDATRRIGKCFAPEMLFHALLSSKTRLPSFPCLLYTSDAADDM
eukprot:67502-Rhodomonas_salina.1